MQATEADINNHKNNGDEEAINFRPSLNFVYMKKYRKPFKEALSGEEQASSASTEEESCASSSDSSMVQPPLPPHPPPPDSPLQLTLKREVEDDEYQTGNDESRNQSEHSLTNYKPDALAPTDEKEKTMCRQFARGMCTRGASCIYAHELILSQLPGIYTFCKNFQNSGCSFPKCKFVHATVFEKEYFYRTGYLPPHSLAHLKDSSAAVGPPAPAPAPAPPLAPDGGPVEVPTAFPNPPPPVMLSGGSTPAASGAGGASGGGSGGGSGGAAADPLSALAAAAAALSPRKRDWADLDEFGRDLDLAEPLQKKCRNCDLTEFRLQYHKKRVVTLTRSSLDTNKKVALVTKMLNKLRNVFLSLLKNSNCFKAGGSNLLNNFNNRNDNEKAVMDKLLMFMGNNRNSLGAEENNSKGVNISTVLVRMLLSAGEPADAS